eukprot:jgi/Chlat1/5377/Chrsp35S05296
MKAAGQLAAVLCVLVAALSSVAAVDTDIVNTEITREVDISESFARLSTTIKFENKGKASVTAYRFGLPANHASRLAHVDADVDDLSATTTKVDSVTTAPSGIAVYEVALSKPVEAGKSATIDLELIVTQVLEPFPEEVLQSDVPKVKYTDNHFFLSPYLTQKQTTKVLLASSTIESKTEEPPTKVSGEQITYGQYSDIAPYTISPLVVHYEHAKPFAVVDRLVREIQVSHWGSVQVEEYYELRHGGAKHKGQFSRLDFQRAPQAFAIASLNELHATLPAGAHSAYYRDAIGNISTSHLRVAADKVELQISPRFPLMGGWRTAFTFGYSLPLDKYLTKRKSGELVLQLPFASPIEDVTVEDLTVRIALPEGASGIHYELPFAVSRSDDVKFSYLDTVGRPVLVLNKQNVVSEHNVKLKVVYKSSALSELRKVALLVVAFTIFFAACLAYVRFDFPISKGPAYQAKLSRKEVSALVERLAGVFLRRKNAYDRLDYSLRELYSSRNQVTYEIARKKTEGELKDTSVELKTIFAGLEAKGSPALVAKVRDLDAKERERQLLVQQLALQKQEYTKKDMPEKEIISRIAPRDAKNLSLNKEIDGLLASIEDLS